MDRGSKKKRLGLIATLAGATLALAAGPALASGAGAHTFSSWVSALGSADGLQFWTYGPGGDVGSGVVSFTHVRGYFNTNSNYYNGVGWLIYNGTGNHYISYEISDQNGAYTYYCGGGNFTTGDTLDALFTHNGGNSWYFYWYNKSTGASWAVDANNAYASTPGFDQASVGADGWGGGPNGYSANNQWGWQYQDSSNYSWDLIPTDGTYNWGNTPTWDVWGDAANGNAVDESTISCP